MPQCPKNPEKNASPFIAHFCSESAKKLRENQKIDAPATPPRERAHRIYSRRGTIVLKPLAGLPRTAPCANLVVCAVIAVGDHVPFSKASQATGFRYIWLA